jgi:opacity protein-like surface antigen
LKLKLILFTVVLAFASMAHAQGIWSNLSIAGGAEGIFPASTFTKAATIANSGNGGAQDTTNSVGYVGDLRYDFGRHSAVGFSYTFNRNTEYFFSQTEVPNHIQTNNSEMIGTYIFRLPSNDRVKPFALFGGGLVRFQPNNDYITNGVPATDTKPAFAYGFGSDFKVSDHWALRLQYRGLIRAEPDFKLASSGFGTSLRTHVPEPSLEVVYHF